MGDLQTNTIHFSNFEEFLRFEEHSEIRYEYHDGEVFAMAGTTLVHNELVDSFKDTLKGHFIPKGCKVYSESVKLEAIRNFYYPYPDVMLTCHEADKQEQYIIRRPVLIAEVLSKTSEETDRKFKWQRYKKLPSLLYYVLISQYERLVEVYGRVEESDTWLYESFTEPTDQVLFERLDFSTTVGQLYDNITLPPEEVMSYEL